MALGYIHLIVEQRSPFEKNGECEVVRPGKKRMFALFRQDSRSLRQDAESLSAQAPLTLPALMADWDWTGRRRTSATV
jgi:hypothetical protein